MPKAHPLNIPQGGLRCTPNGTYKIRRDGQTDIIDPSAMAQIIVELERKRILNYLRSAVRPEIEDAQSEMEAKYEEALSEIDNLPSQTDELDERDDDYDYSKFRLEGPRTKKRSARLVREL